MTRRYDGVDFSGVDPLDFAWSFGGNSYMGIPGSTGYRTETLESSFLGLVQGAYKRNSVVFSCIRARLSVFSEGRFQFQRMNNGTPGDLWGDSSDGRTAGSSGLRLLENPWPNGTTGDLLTRMLQDADLAGNSYWTVRNGNLRRMRPDWVSIVMGSRTDSQIGPDDLDAELLGYFYWPGGPMNKQQEPVYLLADEVAHFAPTPDPIAHYRGMSWLTPIIREVEADTAATVHKLAFFQNGATLQTIVSFKDMKQEVFEAFVKKMDLAHKGAQNAYKTLYLGGGADATVVGADLKQLDFKTVQGAGETRIAAAAGVPPAIVGLSEGLQGSSLNAGNLGQLRRQFAEGTLSTLWRNAASSLATLVPPPSGSELVIDKRFIPFLREDHKDRADIAQQQASTIVALINGGYEPKSVTAAVEAEDWSLLVHTGLLSVQLQAPGAGALPGSPEAAAAPPVAGVGTAPRPVPASVARGIQTLHEGATERLHEYWVHGKGAAQIGWGAPGDFDRCTALLEEHAHMSPEQAHGYCNLAHHSALGYYPATHAKMLGKRNGQDPPGSVNGRPKAPAAIAARAWQPEQEDDGAPWDEDALALYWAIAELCGDASPITRAAWNPDLHPRDPHGRFMSTLSRVKDKLEKHLAGNGKGDPFEGFSREQLRRVAKQRGIELQRGEGRDSIANKLLDHLGAKATKPRAPRKPKPPAPHEPHTHEHGLPKLGEAPRLDHSGIVQAIHGGDLAEVDRELDVQAALTPTAYKKLSSVIGDPHMPAGTNGEYYPSQRAILLNGHTILDQGGSRAQSARNSKMSTPFHSHGGHDHTDLQSTLAHEYGHHVDLTLRLADRQQLFKALAGELGTTPPAAGLGDIAFEPWVNRNRTKIMKNVSTYAATNPRELMAEIWAEYSTNPDARPLVKAVGGLMRRLSEGRVD